MLPRMHCQFYAIVEFRYKVKCIIFNFITLPTVGKLFQFDLLLIACGKYLLQLDK